MFRFALRHRPRGTFLFFLPASSFLLALTLWAFAPAPECQARGTYEPPHTGFEDPQARPKMKGNPGAGALIDAYGFPISPDEGQEAQKRKRLPPGAYGGYGQKSERPLPNPEDNKPLWKVQ